MKILGFQSISGVYKITNLKTKKVYIGQSVNVYTRINEHISELIKNKHVNISLQQDFIKYGAEVFDAKIIEQCPKDKLLEREYFWMLHYRKKKAGLYNIQNNPFWSKE